MKRSTAKKQPCKTMRAKRQSQHTAEKGKLVEAITARLHALQGITVQRNAHLPAKSSPKRTREIDVLLTHLLMGSYPVRIAFECKNETSPIGIGRIDEFIGKLQDVDIPCQHGIYVSVNGYTQGALERAKERGIRTLILEGLSDDRLSEELQDALFSHIYLYLNVHSFTVPGIESDFIDDSRFEVISQQGKVGPSILSVILKQWLKSKNPADHALGKRNFEVGLPEGWAITLDGNQIPNNTATVTLSVQCLLVTCTGVRKHVRLKDAIGGHVVKEEIQEKSNLHDIISESGYESEEALSKALPEDGSAQTLLRRVLLGRLRIGSEFFPPIWILTGDNLAQLLAPDQRGVARDIVSIQLNEVEGLRLEKIENVHYLRRLGAEIKNDSKDWRNADPRKTFGDRFPILRSVQELRVNK